MSSLHLSPYVKEEEHTKSEDRHKSSLCVHKNTNYVHNTALMPKHHYLSVCLSCVCPRTEKKKPAIATKLTDFRGLSSVFYGLATIKQQLQSFTE